MSLVQTVLQSKLFKSRDGNIATSLNRNKIAIRKNNVILLAVRSSVRFSKVGNDGYSVLDLNLDFQPESLLLNSSENLLAIFDDHNLVIATLPILLNNTASLISVKSFKISPDLLKETQILDVLWNPISRYDSNIVILTSDNIIRSFDPFTSLMTPESLYHLNSSNQIGLSSTKVQSPLSITFGSAKRLSGTLSLYITDKEGDLFVIYPFLPKRISVTKDSVEELLNESVIQVNTIVDSEDYDEILKKLAIEQLKFVTNLWRQVPTALKEVRDTQELVVLETTSIENFHIQGPFSISPYPEELYDDYVTSFTRISSHVTDLLAIGFEKNGVLVLLPDSRIIMRWNHDEDNQSNLELSLIGHFKGASGIKTFVNNVGESLLIQNNGNVKELDFKNVFEILNKALNEGNPEIFNSLKLNPYVKREIKGDYVGYGKLKGYDDDYLLLIQSSDIFISPGSDKIIKENNDQEETISLEYKSLFDKDIELKSLFEDLKQFKLKVKSVDKISADEESLKLLDNLSQQVLKQLIKIHRLGLSVNYKLNNQKDEFENQIEKTFEVSKNLETLSKKDRSIEEAIKRQKKINERFEELHHKLSRDTNLPISSKELQWFKEIQTLTRSFNNSLKKNISLNEQLVYVKNELKRTRVEDHTEHDWDELNQILQNGKKLIDTKLNI